jgi:hypothetical protein
MVLASLRGRSLLDSLTGRFLVSTWQGANFVVAEYWAHFAVWVSQPLLARATLIVRIPSRVRDFSNACAGENARSRPAPRES